MQGSEENTTIDIYHFFKKTNTYEKDSLINASRGMLPDGRCSGENQGGLCG
jgi:hypothetical protein